MKQVTLRTVPAEEIEQGECFRKKTGTHIYLRISDSAVRFYIEKGLDKEATPDKIYGVCLVNGNMCSVEKDTQVWREVIGWTKEMDG
jgi:hypothetical protein